MDMKRRSATYVMSALLTITNSLKIYSFKIRDIILLLRAPLWKGSQEFSKYYIDQHIDTRIPQKYHFRFFAKLLSRVSLEVGSDLILKKKSPLLWEHLSSYKKIEKRDEEKQKKLPKSYKKEIVKRSLISHALDLQINTIDTWCKKTFPHVHNIKFLGFQVGQLFTTGSVSIGIYVVLYKLLNHII